MEIKEKKFMGLFALEGMKLVWPCFTSITCRSRFFFFFIRKNWNKKVICSSMDERERTILLTMKKLWGKKKNRYNS